MKGLLAAGLLMGAAAGQVIQAVKVGKAASEVKFQHGRLLVLEAGPVLRMLEKSGRETARFLFKEGMEDPPRKAEVLDFSLTGDGRLGASVSALYRFGRTKHGIFEWNLKNPGVLSSFEETLEFLCWKLIGDEKTGFWCLGPGLKPLLLHRLGGGGWRPLSVMRGDREMAQTGMLGLPGLMEWRTGSILAWLPAVGRLVEVVTETGELREHDVDVEGEGRALMTMAAGEGRVYALMPLRKKGEVETLKTKYGVFVLDIGGWRRLEAAGELERGARLAGVEGDQVVIWNRAEERVEWRVTGFR